MSVVLFLSSLSSSGNQRQVLALPHLHSIWQLDLHIWASFLCGEKGGRSALWPLGARVPHNVPPPPFHISSALPVPGGRHNMYIYIYIYVYILGVGRYRRYRAALSRDSYRAIRKLSPLIYSQSWVWISTKEGKVG